MDDEATYKLLQSGRTQGVFQFESEGIRGLLRSLKPDNIRDIIASTALYRPGPLQGGLVESYINRKHKREEPTYVHPIMKTVLEETHGVMVYQEQVMRILNLLGGIELSSAYACIKAISKKKTDIIDQRRAEFIKGAVERGVKKDVAQEIFEQIVVFGGYGFNKSHSAAYALVSYQTAYLKAHYPAEFMAAVLTSELGDTDKVAEHVRNTKEMGLEVQAPDINSSDADFGVAGEQAISFGLVAIRGLGRKAAEAIVQERTANGPFRDLFEICERVDGHLVPRSGLESLIKAGALDKLAPEGNRAALMIALPGAVQEATSLQEDKKHGQGSIFDLLGDGGGKETVKGKEPTDVAYCRSMGSQGQAQLREGSTGLLLLQPSAGTARSGIDIRQSPSHRYREAVSRFGSDGGWDDHPGSLDQCQAEQDRRYPHGPLLLRRPDRQHRMRHVPRSFRQQQG